jgi:hypothetical protein
MEVTGTPEELTAHKILDDLCCRCPRAETTATAIATAVSGPEGCDGKSAQYLSGKATV